MQIDTDDMMGEDVAGNGSALAGKKKARRCLRKKEEVMEALRTSRVLCYFYVCLWYVRLITVLLHGNAREHLLNGVLHAVLRNILRSRPLRRGIVLCTAVQTVTPGTLDLCFLLGALLLLKLCRKKMERSAVAAGAAKRRCLVRAEDGDQCAP